MWLISQPQWTLYNHTGGGNTWRYHAWNICFIRIQSETFVFTTCVYSYSYLLVSHEHLSFLTTPTMSITMNKIDFKRVRYHFHAPRNNCRESLSTVWYTSTRIDWTLCSSIVVHLHGMIFVSIIHVLFLPLSCCMQYHVLISGANLEPFCVHCKHMHIWNSSITITSLVILICVHNEPDVHAKMTHIKSLSDKKTGC